MTSDSIDDHSGAFAPKHHREFLLRDPGQAPRRARRKRFVFVLVSVLLTGTVATMAARLVTAEWATTRSYTQWMMDDLERLIVAQRSFHDQHGRYASQNELGRAFVPSQAVHVTIVAADDTGWHGAATHLRSDDRCIVTVGIGESVLRNMPSAKPTCSPQ